MMHILSLGQKIPMTPATETKNPQPIITEQQAQEKAWARAAQQGDQVAFMNIVEAYQRPVYNLCYRMLNDPAEAEDAAQETFLRAYTKIKSYQPGRKFSSWLFSIASHYCIDRLRRRKHHTISWEDLPPWQIIPAPQPEPEQAALTHEVKDTLLSLLDTLAPEYRAAIILRYWYEMSYDEIAETLDTTVSAIKSRLFRAKQQMGERLGAKEEISN
jgi:RNA polymerase sigma-70 factor (ECF subfamily)